MIINSRSSRGVVPGGREVGTLEPLEARRLMDADPGVWAIFGDDAANSIRIRHTGGGYEALLDGRVIDTRSGKGLRLIEVHAGGGDDIVAIELPDADPSVAIWIHGGTGHDHLIGSSGNEMMLGGYGRDTLEGGKGNDTLRGGRGHDGLFGGDGDDYLQGNAGTDTLAGGWGADKLTGGKGVDQLHGGHDEDVVYGGRGDDTIKGGAEGDFLSGGGAVNHLYRQSAVDQVVDNPLDTFSDDDTHDSLSRVATDVEFRQWLIERAVQQWKWAFGQSQAEHYWGHTRGMVLRAASDASFDVAMTTAVADFSATNIQTAGVDEADLVETDGEHLYMLRQQELIIADASPADELSIKSRTSFEGRPSGIYLDGNRLTVISEVGGWNHWFSGGVIALDIAGGGGGSAAQPQVTVSVYDISDKSAPALLEETTLDGRLSSSRMIDGRLYLVMQNYLSAPPPELHDAENPDEPNAKVYETEADYRARLEAGLVDEMIPRYAAESAGGATSSGSLIAAPDVYVRDGERLDVTTVALLNTRDAELEPAATSIVGAGGQVYASAESLYLAGYAWNGNVTEVVKFGLGIDQVTLDATGEVDGSVLNQFAMDEHGEYFRVATTRNDDGQTSSGVYVLDQVGQDLDVVGTLEGLGLTETIRSARFMGDRGYLVTFRQTDPLFSLDLSDPFDPKVTGELKIPGFSSYLHPIGEDHLIGIGREADENGRVGGVQVSLFNVADPANPVRVDAFAMEVDGSSYSLAEQDHHAVSYFADQGVLAIPVMGLEGGSQYNVLQLLRIDPEDGIEEAGQVSHGGQVLRSVRIGENLYSIGNDAIKVQSFADLNTEIANLDLSGA